MSSHGRQASSSTSQRTATGPAREPDPSGSTSQTFTENPLENQSGEGTHAPAEPRRASRDSTPEAAQLSEEEKQIFDELEGIVDGFRRGQQSKIDAITVTSGYSTPLKRKRNYDESEPYTGKRLKGEVSSIDRIPSCSLLSTEHDWPSKDQTTTMSHAIPKDHMDLTLKRVGRKSRSQKLEIATSLGTKKRDLLEKMKTLDASETESCFNCTSKTPLQPNDRSPCLEQLPVTSHQQNGINSSGENSQISMPYIPLSTISELLGRIEGISEIVKSSLATAIRFEESRTLGNGLLQQTSTEKLLALHGLTGEKNGPNITATSSAFSLPSHQVDRGTFDDLRDAILDTGGINHCGSSRKSGGKPAINRSGGSGGSQGNSRAVCKRWNTNLGCPFDASKCFWRHVCRRCGGNHRKTECPQNITN